MYKMIRDTNADGCETAEWLFHFTSEMKLRNFRIVAENMYYNSNVW